MGGRHHSGIMGGLLRNPHCGRVQLASGGRHIQRSEPGVIWNFDRVAAFRLGVSAYKDRRLRGSDCHYFRAPFSVELFLLFREVKPMHRLYAV